MTRRRMLALLALALIMLGALPGRKVAEKSVTGKSTAPRPAAAVTARLGEKLTASRDLQRPLLPDPQADKPAVDLAALTAQPRPVDHVIVPVAAGTPAPPAGGARGRLSPVATRGPAVALGKSPAGPNVADWYAHRVALGACESGDQYANKRNPRYRGFYQIGFTEWAAYGGTGYDPADAPPAEQDAIALQMFEARGWQPWTCARILHLY